MVSQVTAWCGHTIKNVIFISYQNTFSESQNWFSLLQTFSIFTSTFYFGLLLFICKGNILPKEKQNQLCCGSLRLWSMYLLRGLSLAQPKTYFRFSCLRNSVALEIFSWKWWNQSTWCVESQFFLQVTDQLEGCIFSLCCKWPQMECISNQWEGRGARGSIKQVHRGVLLTSREVKPITFILLPEWRDTVCGNISTQCVFHLNI